MLRALLDRLRRAFARLFRRPRVAAPGQWTRGKESSWRGLLRVAPWVLPSREYLLYEPGTSRLRRWNGRPLLVLLHGCRQAPEEFASAMGIAELADAHGFLVLLPRQSEKANAWRCWNWFDGATADGNGEAAIVVAQVRAVQREYRVDAGSVFVAGMSAGGALAATLAVRHPDRFAGVLVHSGLPCGAARSVASATTVMKRGPDVNVAEIGNAARTRAGGKVRMPAIVVQGEADEVVAMANARALVRQFLALNGLPAGAGEDAMPEADAARVEALEGGREMKVADYTDARGVVVRFIRVPGLGHAWSGGDKRHPFNDPLPPSSAQVLVEAMASWRGTA